MFKSKYFTCRYKLFKSKKFECLYLFFNGDMREKGENADISL